MLLMIELFIGDYKGFVNYSGISLDVTEMSQSNVSGMLN